MNKAPTALLLLLTAAVAGLGLYAWHLGGRIDERGGSRTAAARSESREEGYAGERMQRLEREIDRLQSELDRVGREPAGGREAGGAEVPAQAPAAEPKEPFVPEKDAAGDWIITPEAEEYFIALQQRADRRRRVDAMARASMRRIDALVSKNEIAALREETRTQIDAVVRRYAAATDDVYQKYFRDPQEEPAGMTGEERREAIRRDRDALFAQALRDLEPIVGGNDAKRIAESSFQIGGGRARNAIGRVGDGPGRGGGPGEGR